jgi:septum formation protein
VPANSAASPPLLILASRSPRRAWLLREAGYPCAVLDPPFIDPPQPLATGLTTDLEKIVVDLALAKAHSLASSPAALERLGRGAVVLLAADTVVVAADGTLLGQPADRDDAARMLHALLGATHRVVTGVALLALPGPGAPVVFADTAQVQIGPVAAAEVAAYLAGDAWRGKAGAYNLAELRDRWPIQVRGDPDTVVGLPMRRLQPILRDLGITPKRT